MTTEDTSWSFRAKFLLSTVIATLVVPTVGGVIFFQTELQSTKDLILRDSTIRTENIAQSLFPALAFDDIETAREQVKALTDNPDFTSASLWKNSSQGESELFWSSEGSPPGLRENPPEIGNKWSESSLWIVRPVKSASQTLGKIEVERSLAPLQFKKDQYQKLGLTSWIIMIALILLVTVWYQNTLTRPLEELTRVAEKISSEKNYSLRAKKTSKDEFGKLTNLFNEMLDSINESNQQLLSAHQEMEERVEMRTRELSLANDKLISEIKEKEKATKQLMEARDRLSKQEKLASVGQVSSNIAHELRNPMTAIRNSTYFLRLKNKGDAKASHHLELIDRELSRSDDVIQRLLELTKGESLKREPVDLRELAAEAMAYSNVAGDYSLSVRFIPKFFTINIDRILFRQVLCNLFLNAIQAMPEGGTIKLLVERHEDGIISMKISDSGIGIQRKNLQKIFEPLFTIREEGVGLGLSLCRDLIIRHGGSIKAESETEVGTTILITLPEVALSFEIMENTKTI